MSFVCIFFLFLLLLVNYRIEKVVYSPTVSFSFLYLLIFVLSSFGWFGIYKAKDDAFLLLFLGIICFITGSWIYISLTNRRKPCISFLCGQYQRLNLKIYYSLLILCLAILSISMVTIGLFLVTGGGIGDVYILAAHATDGETNDLSKDSFLILLESYIAYPILYTLVPVSIVEFFHTYKKRYISIAIMLSLIRVALDARRTFLASFILMLIICILLHRKDGKIVSENLKLKIKKYKRFSIVPIIVFGFLFSFISEQRSIAASGEDNTNILKTFTYYYGGCVQFLGYCMEHFKGEFTYGISSLRGFFAPFFGVLNIIGIPSPDALQNANDYLENLHMSAIPISPTKTFNSFATCFFQFYCDAGYIGIVFFSTAFGYISEVLFTKMRYVGSRISEVKYVFFYANILMLSFVNMETVVAFNFWPLIIVCFLYHKAK